MKAIIESAGAVASRVRLGSHELLYDQPMSVPGGEDRGPSPLDAMAAAVGACAHYFSAAVLHARKIDTAGLRVEVEAEKVREPSPRYGRFSIRVILPAGVPERYMPLIERAVRGCPAYGTLLHPPEVEISISRDSGEADAPAAPHVERTADSPLG
jgi:uncharacterized OsmC-like protein